ncbi:Adenylate kinase/UMP-CMP kinase like protein [Aduncisulcus paluster]|uniref:Adenylate kinase/UMP-CMP kinase like protein n=1 Tax=Aduncisulcus paluster TaxID=2918883 RepID=A0ABQ5JWB1_9EUKA|nr:Adenylate kinase/UMP-CMP kinase like protein [Aduncisulcus paluster]
MPEVRPIFSILGLPCSGKGTQGFLLQKHLNIRHISAGDCLRAEMAKEDSEHKKLIDYYIKEGLIVPAEITVALLRAVMESDSSSAGFLIDGFPRAIEQYQCFIKHARPMNGVIYVKAAEELALSRMHKRIAEWKEQGKVTRTDDNDESMKKRFRVYKSQTAPVISLFRRHSRIIELDGAGTPDKVFAILSKLMKEFLSSSKGKHGLELTEEDVKIGEEEEKKAHE